MSKADGFISLIAVVTYAMPDRSDQENQVMMTKFTHQTVAVAFICLLVPGIMYAQDPRERTIEKISAPYPGMRRGPLHREPVEFVELKVAGQSVKPGISFLADDDWLKGLTMTLKNVSGKPILGVVVRLEIQIIDPKVPPFLLIDLNFGRETRPLKDNDEKVMPLPIEDGQSITLTLTDARYSSIQRTRAARGALPAINRVRMSLIFVVYDDDTAWAIGDLVRRDPGNSGSWSIIRPEAEPPQ